MSEPIIVCRAGVGDPLALGEATLLERDARAVLEGLLRKGRSVGAVSGRVYLGGRAAERREGLLREVDRLRDFEITVHEAPAALVCTEESAFLRAVEGGRPVPDFAPPFPGSTSEAPRFLCGRPVVVTDPATLLSERDDSSSMLYTLVGDVDTPGVVEAPIGITLRELVLESGGGIAGGGDLKAVSVGGPTGGWLPPALLDLPVTDEALRRVGAHLGAGTVAAVAHPGCAVHLARGALDVLARENCGRCVVCREGTMQMAEILAGIAGGTSRAGDLDLLNELARALKLLGTCDWGRTAADPVLTALAYFRDDFEAHVRLKACPAGVCAREAG